MNKRRAFAIAAVCLCAVAGVVLDACCAALFVRRQQIAYNPYFHHTMRGPYFRGTAWWGGRSYPLITNSLSFKDRTPRTVSLTPQGYRILFIGDSFTEGVGVPYEKTFVGIIDEHLRKRNIEVLNAGVGSYAASSYYLKVRYLLEQAGLRFNELFVYVDKSDFIEELYFQDYYQRASPLHTTLFRAHHYLQAHSFIYYTVWSSRVFPSAKEWVRATLGFGAKDEPVFTRRVKWDMVHDATTEEGVRLCLWYLAKLKELCDAHGVKMTVAVYPYAYDLLTGHEHARHEQLLRDFCRQHQAEFLDYFPVFFEKFNAGARLGDFFIPNDIHWNENGHSVIAEGWLARYGERIP